MFLSDGTEVCDEEYFGSLANQSVVVASHHRRLKTFSLLGDQLKNVLERVRWQHPTQQVVCQIRDLFNAADDDVKERWVAVKEYVAAKTDKRLVQATHIKDHPEWFEGSLTKNNPSCIYKGFFPKAFGQNFGQNFITANYIIS